MIIITGAAGFIGSNIVSELNSLGKTDLLLVDEADSSRDQANLADLAFTDYLNKKDLKNYLTHHEKVETIIHMGACSSTTETDAHYLRQNNFEFSRDLASWSLNNGSRFIYASSAATYGDGSNGYIDNEDNVENLRPLNLYGYSKQLMDMWAHEGRHFKKIVGLKYFNVYGPREYHKGNMRSMVLKAYQQIKNTGKVQLFKSLHPDYQDGEQKRDFIYVKDAVAMTLHFHFNPQATAGLYNVGTGKARTWIDMMKAIFAALNLEPHIEFIPLPDAIAQNYQYFTEANMQKMWTQGGYIERCLSLEEGVEDYVQSLNKHFGPA